MLQAKTHWRKIDNPDYLGAYALDPRQEPVYTIDRVVKEEVTGEGGKKEMCRVAHFKEKGIKPMILNATNSKVVQKFTGSPYIEDWGGCRIQVYATSIKVGGEDMEALRIRPTIPRDIKEDMTPEHPRWNDAVAALSRGENTVNGVKKSYRLSAANEQLLMEKAAEMMENEDA